MKLFKKQQLRKSIILLLILLSISVFLGVKNANRETMEAELTHLEQYIANRDALDTKVSQVPVAWHLDHSLKVIINICDSLKTSDPATYTKNFNATRWFCYTFNYIPRGKAKSPKSVLPPESITTEALLTQLQIAKKKIMELEDLAENVHFRHPYFEDLNKKQSLRFLELHTHHHLKIVRDILETSP